MARLRASWRTSLPVVQQPRNPQSESIARSPYDCPGVAARSAQKGRVAKFWRLRLVEPAGGICTSEPEGPHDPERDCREAEAPVEGRLQGPALRGGADPTGRLVVPPLPAQLSRHRRAVSGARLGGRPLHPEPVGAGLRAPDREETAGLPEAPLRLNPGR